MLHNSKHILGPSYKAFLCPPHDAHQFPRDYCIPARRLCINVCSTATVKCTSIALAQLFDTFSGSDTVKNFQKDFQTKGTPDTILFSVLCMHDYTSSGDGMLSFKKGEILDIIQGHDVNGWWAAIKTEGSKVGWISKSYAQQLSEEMADRLRNIPQVVRVHEYNAEELYNMPVGLGVNRL